MRIYNDDEKDADLMSLRFSSGSAPLNFLFELIRALFSWSQTNPAYRELLQQSSEDWNKWRKENPTEHPKLRRLNLQEKDLRKVDLNGADLSGAKLGKADLSEAKLHKANLSDALLYEAKLTKSLLYKAFLNGAGLSMADLSEADLSKAVLTKAVLTKAVLSQADMSEAILCRANLRKAVLHKANLRGADMSNANLEGADLSGVNFSGARLIQTNLSRTTITGACLYGTARDDWNIDGIKCDYIFWDMEAKRRTPEDRDFEPDEFESLYKQLPTFEYIFEHNFTVLDQVIMDQVVRAINERRPEIELKLDSFHSRGQPHAVFTVLHKSDTKEALEEVKTGYKTRLKVLEGQKDQLMQVIQMLASGNNIHIETIGGNAIIQQVGRDVGGNISGQDSITSGKEQCSISAIKNCLEDE